MSRSAVIQTIDHSKTYRSRRNVQSIPPPMKNERYKPNNPTETRTVSARTPSTQTPCRSGDKRPAPDTGILNWYQPAAADMPRRSGFPKGSGEVLERDRGFANPLSLSNRPREEQIKSTHTMWYSPLVKPIKTTTDKRRFLIIKAKNISKRRSISRLQVKK